jgi:hypothetical protein
MLLSVLYKHLTNFDEIWYIRLLPDVIVPFELSDKFINTKAWYK